MIGSATIVYNNPLIFGCKSCFIQIAYYLCSPLEKETFFLAGMMELVDMLDLGSSAARRGGSI